MPSTESLRLFNGAYDNFLSLDFSLFYREGAGNLSLKNELEPIFESLRDKLEKTATVKHLLPDSVLAELSGIFSKAYDYLIGLSAMDDLWFLSNRNVITSEISQVHNSLLLTWPAVVSIYIENNQQSIEDLKRRSDEDAKSIAELRSKLENQLRAFDKRIEPLLTSGEILKQEDIYFKSAKSNSFQSRFWLVAVFIGIALTIFLVYFFFLTDKTCVACQQAAMNEKFSEKERIIAFYIALFQSIGARILIIATMFLALKFLFKNYYALMHNSTINIHKANSLAAAQNIIKGFYSSENESREKILNLVAQEIFSQHKTGYLSKDIDYLNLALLEKLASIVKK